MSETSEMFGGSGTWIFALLVLLLIGGGGFGFGNNTRVGEQYATQADIQRAVDFDTLKNSISGVNENVISSVKDAAYNNLSEIRDNGALISAGFSNLKDCCCETNRNIDSVRLDMANYASAIQANDTANTQKVLDAIAQNKIESLQAQVNQLQLQSAMCGVVRYPNAATYCAGTYPSSCGCSSSF